MGIHPGGTHRHNRIAHILRAQPPGQDQRAGREFRQAAADRPIVGLAGGAVRPAVRVVGVGDEGIDIRAEALHPLPQSGEIIPAHDQALNHQQIRIELMQFAGFCRRDGPMQLHNIRSQGTAKRQHLQGAIQVSNQHPGMGRGQFMDDRRRFSFADILPVHRQAQRKTQPIDPGIDQHLRLRPVDNPGNLDQIFDSIFFHYAILSNFLVHGLHGFTRIDFGNQNSRFMTYMLIGHGTIFPRAHISFFACTFFSVLIRVIRG